MENLLHNFFLKIYEYHDPEIHAKSFSSNEWENISRNFRLVKNISHLFKNPLPWNLTFKEVMRLFESLVHIKCSPIKVVVLFQVYKLEKWLLIFLKFWSYYDKFNQIYLQRFFFFGRKGYICSLSHNLHFEIKGLYL